FTSLACFSYLTLLVLLSFPTRRSSDLDRLVKRFLSNQVMYDNLLLLPLPVQPSVGLLVKLQAVRQAKPDDDIAARLQVQAMPGAGSVRQVKGNIACVPVADFIAPLQHPGLTESLQDAVAVMLVYIKGEYWLSSARLDDIFQGVQFGIMNKLDIFIFIIGGALGQLQQLIDQYSPVRRYNVAALSEAEN